MQTGFIKGLKPKFIKQMALLMSICYLMTPLQNQITSVLHELSHSLEMPNSVLSHKSNEHSFIKIHEPHEHETQNSSHEHPLIDLVDFVFDSSKENHKSDKKSLSKEELKKHITLNKVILPIKFKNNSNKLFFVHEAELRVGFSEELDAPPKFRFT